MNLQPSFEIGFAVGSFISLALIAKRCFFRIEQGHIGVLLDHGKVILKNAEKKLLSTWGPGLHFKFPWQVVRAVKMMEQSLDLSGKEGGITAMANDGTILRLDSKIRFTPIKTELYDFLFELKDPIAHIRGLFTCLLRNEIANFQNQLSDLAEHTGSYSNIRRERKLLNQHIELFTRQKIGGRYGLRFDGVDLTDILPPDELAHALNAVFNAHTEAEAAYARAEGEAQQRVLAAEKGKEIATAKAAAVETEILTLAKFLRDLKQKGMLDHYIARRKNETYSESRAVFVRRTT